MWSHLGNAKFHHLNRGDPHATEPRPHFIGESAELSKKGKNLLVHHRKASHKHGENVIFSFIICPSRFSPATLDVQLYLLFQGRFKYPGRLKVRVMDESDVIPHVSEWSIRSKSGGKRKYVK